MKTAIVYYSEHHGNTKKLLDAIAGEYEVTLIDVTKEPDADLTGYDRIGLASGIYFSNFAKQLIAYTKEHLPEGKDVFYVYTHGAPRGDFLKTMREIAEQKHCKELGFYHCQAYDTFGPFKLVGGLNKGHPTVLEIRGAIEFYSKL